MSYGQHIVRCLHCHTDYTAGDCITFCCLGCERAGHRGIGWKNDFGWLECPRCRASQIAERYLAGLRRDEQRRKDAEREARRSEFHKQRPWPGRKPVGGGIPAIPSRLYRGSLCRNTLMHRRRIRNTVKAAGTTSTTATIRTESRSAGHSAKPRSLPDSACRFTRHAAVAMGTRRWKLTIAVGMTDTFSWRSLLAAAPDLYTACLKAREIIKGPYTEDQVFEALDYLQIAIAKAEGK